MLCWLYFTTTTVTTAKTATTAKTRGGAACHLVGPLVLAQIVIKFSHLVSGLFPIGIEILVRSLIESHF